MLQDCQRAHLQLEAEDLRSCQAVRRCFDCYCPYGWGKLFKLSFNWWITRLDTPSGILLKVAHCICSGAKWPVSDAKKIVNMCLI